MFYFCQTVGFRSDRRGRETAGAHTRAVQLPAARDDFSKQEPVVADAGVADTVATDAAILEAVVADNACHRRCAVIAELV